MGWAKDSERDPGGRWHLCTGRITCELQGAWSQTVSENPAGPQCWYLIRFRSHQGPTYIANSGRFHTKVIPDLLASCPSCSTYSSGAQGAVGDHHSRRSPWSKRTICVLSPVIPCFSPPNWELFYLLFQCPNQEAVALEAWLSHHDNEEIYQAYHGMIS